MLQRAEAVTSRTLAELPGPVRELLKTVPIHMERFPDRADEESGIDPDTLGFCEENCGGIVRIRLWLENILEYSGNRPRDFDEEVRTTLLHEIGHVLGWDEEEVEDRGLG